MPVSGVRSINERSPASRDVVAAYIDARARLRVKRGIVNYRRWHRRRYIDASTRENAGDNNQALAHATEKPTTAGVRHRRLCEQAKRRGRVMKCCRQPVGGGVGMQAARLSRKREAHEKYSSAKKEIGIAAAGGAPIILIIVDRGGGGGGGAMCSAIGARWLRRPAHRGCVQAVLTLSSTLYHVTIIICPSHGAFLRGVA